MRKLFLSCAQVKNPRGKRRFNLRTSGICRGISRLMDLSANKAAGLPDMQTPAGALSRRPRAYVDRNALLNRSSHYIAGRIRTCIWGGRVAQIETLPRFLLVSGRFQVDATEFVSFGCLASGQVLNCAFWPGVRRRNHGFSLTPWGEST